MNLFPEQRLRQSAVDRSQTQAGLLRRALGSRAARQGQDQFRIAFLPATYCHRSLLSEPAGGFSRSLPAQALGLPARELLPALDDHVTVRCVEFHQVRPASGLFGGDQGRAAAAKQV
jgi:hypothetical protein